MTLHLESVTKSFDRPVLDGLSLDVSAGEFVAVIGPSGCGKSTLLNLVAGLDTPSSGRVEGNGECAYMPQRDLLFPWRSVLENTAIGLEVQGVPRRIARERARRLFPVFGLAGYEDARPRELSGGMRQRAGMLRTVVQERGVLLLDEPFGALDSLTRTELQGWLQDVWQDYRWTVLMITHDVREAVFLADRVVVLSQRPARVRRELVVDLPRPRTLATMATPAFATQEQELMRLLHNPPGVVAAAPCNLHATLSPVSRQEVT
jgi:ABC-type nitrate/sulfonate/bicarbonate transport system ATPase subunit